MFSPPPKFWPNGAGVDETDVATLAMRGRLPTTISHEGLPSPSKGKPTRPSLLRRLLHQHTILLLMLSLTVRDGALVVHLQAPPT